MWLFAAISLAIATPCFRSWLEALFAELSIIFFTYLRLVSLCLLFVLLLVLAFHGRRFLDSRRVVQAQLECTMTKAKKNDCRAYSTTSLAHVQWRRGTRRRAFILRAKSTTSEIAGSGFYPPYLWTSSLLALAMLPIITSVVVGGGRQDSSSSFRTLKSETSQTSLDAPSTLMSLQQQTTACRFSKGRQCLDDVTNIPELGDYKQDGGYCVAFDAAYVNLTTKGALPTQYFPIGVQEALTQGYRNNYSAWTEKNQNQFQAVCPLLYNETVLNDANDLLCCTEPQFERLSLQLRPLQGECTTPCMANVRNLWCQFTCHPSNSLFLDVTQVRLMEGDTDHADDVFPAIEEVTYYVGRDMVTDLHKICEADTDTMRRLCKSSEVNCTTDGTFLEQLGAYNLNPVESQVNFRTMEQLSATKQEDTICGCGLDKATDCVAPVNQWLDGCVGTCNAECPVRADTSRVYEPACYRPNTTSEFLHSVSLSSLDNSMNSTDKIQLLLAEMSARIESRSSAVLHYVVASVAFVATCALSLGVVYSTRYGKKQRVSVCTNPMIVSRDSAIHDHNGLTGISKWDTRVTLGLKRYGDFVAMGNHPLYILLLSLMIVVCCASGLVRLQVETNPLPLWVSDTSAVFQERTRFDEKLGPTERSERLILVAKDGGSVTRSAYLKEAIRLQEIVANEIMADTIALNDICIKGGIHAKCQVQALTQFFQNQMTHFQVYETHDLVQAHLQHCVNAPDEADAAVCTDLQQRLNVSLPDSMADCPCLSSFGEPMTDLDQYLGGSGKDTDFGSRRVSDLEHATMLLSTVGVQNFHKARENSDAVAWERAFLARMKLESEKNALYELYYAAETSADDEFARASNVETLFKTGILVFVALFVYVSCGVTQSKGTDRVFFSSSIGVGFMGVASLFMGVGGTLGLFAWTGVKLQLVTLVAMPLVTFAIGCGNLLLLCHAVALKQNELKREQQSLFTDLADNDFGIHEITCVLVCEAMGDIGPSLVASTLTECCLVACAVFVAMPAAQWLAGTLVLGLAATLSLQLTFFLAILALDKRRELSRVSTGEWCLVARRHFDAFAIATRASQAFSSWSRFQGLTWCVSGFVRLFVMKKTKVLVLFGFGASTLMAIVTLEAIKRGLPPISLLPTHSYVRDYAQRNDWFSKDGPVYFVVETGYKNNEKEFRTLANDPKAQTKFCQSKDFCAIVSVPTLLNAIVAAAASNVTFMRDVAVASWLDDFWGFLEPESECCRLDPRNGSSVPFLGGNRTDFGAHAEVAPSCLADARQVLAVPQNSFMSLFRMFSSTTAGPWCTYAGGTRYHDQFSIDNQPLVAANDVSVIMNGTGYGSDVTAFAYKVLSSISDPQEAVMAYSQAHYLANWISRESGVDVWIYSPEYVYLDQFQSINRSAYVVLGAGMVVVFVFQTVALGRYGVAVFLITALTVLQVAALMVPMDVPLNSLSILSLALAATLAVRISTHVARLFAKTRTLTDDAGVAPSGDVCVKKVMTQVGITWTFGVAVSQAVALVPLALGIAPVFNECFFRILMAGTVCSWLNGMVLLPVGLSVAIDATAGRVRHVKATNEEGDEYSRESPTSWYHSVPLSNK